jgi:AAHS family 4-hydroxybenzoate transporter-like MFS transporter
MEKQKDIESNCRSTQSFDKILDDSPISTTQITVVSISFILMILDGFDITSMSFVAQRISEQLHINETSLGLVFSVTLGGMMLGAIFIAPFADIIGRRKLLIYSVMVIGISMFLTGLVSNYWQLITVRTVTGLGVGSMLANLTALTSEYTPTKYKSFSVAIIAAGFPMGATIGGMVVAPLLPIYGWESVFISLGAATIFMTGVVYFIMPESLQYLYKSGSPEALEQTNFILKRMKHKTILTFPILDRSILPKASVRSLLTPELGKKTLQLWVTFFFVFVSLYFLMSWLPKLVINAGLSESDGVFSAVALNGGGVIGTLLLGWFATNVGLTKLISIFLGIASVIMLGFGLIFEYVNLFVLLFILGFFLQGGFVGLYSTSAKLYPLEVRATGIGWALGLGRLGAVFGPYTGGMLIAYGANMSFNFIVFAFPLLVAGVLAYKLNIN